MKERHNLCGRFLHLFYRRHALGMIHLHFIFDSSASNKTRDRLPCTYSRTTKDASRCCAQYVKVGLFTCISRQAHTCISYSLWILCTFVFMGWLLCVHENLVHNPFWWIFLLVHLHLWGGGSVCMVSFYWQSIHKTFRSWIGEPPLASADLLCPHGMGR